MAETDRLRLEAAECITADEQRVREPISGLGSEVSPSRPVLQTSQGASAARMGLAPMMPRARHFLSRSSGQVRLPAGPSWSPSSTGATPHSSRCASSPDAPERAP